MNERVEFGDASTEVGTKLAQEQISLICSCASCVLQQLCVSSEAHQSDLLWQ